MRSMLLILLLALIAPAAVAGNAGDENAGTTISASGGSIVRGNTVVGKDGLVQLFLNTNVLFSDDPIAGLGRDASGTACSGSTYP